MSRDWRESAACACRAPQFDALIEGESTIQMKARHWTAKQICAKCPVLAECKADFVKHVDSGVRFGEVHGLPRGAIVGNGNGHMKQKSIKHGTESGAAMHRRRDEKVCSACHGAELRARQDRARKAS